MTRLSPVLAAGRTTAAAAARLCLCLRFRLGPIRRLLERSTDATTISATGNPRTIRSTTSIGTSAPGLWLSPPSSASATPASSWLGSSAATGSSAAPAGRSRTLLTAHEKAPGGYATAYSNLL